MWNIRSHARRFPVHTGTLTPSIAHPNRFLNHLKRFSAGFLTFRDGKAEMRTLWGENSPSLLRRQPPLGWGPWHDGKVSGQTSKSAVPERTVTLSVTAYAVPDSPFCRSATFSPGAGEVFPLRGELLDIFRSVRIKLPLSGELAATSGSRLRGSAPPSGELANPQGLTERVKPLPFSSPSVPCSTWNNFTVRRLRWECAPYTRYTRPSLPDGR